MLSWTTGLLFCFVLFVAVKNSGLVVSWWLLVREKPVYLGYYGANCRIITNDL